MTLEKAALFFTARGSPKLLIAEPTHEETIRAEGAWCSLTFTTKTFAFAGIQKKKKKTKPKQNQTKQSTCKNKNLTTPWIQEDVDLMSFFPINSQ